MSASKPLLTSSYLVISIVFVVEYSLQGGEYRDTEADPKHWIDGEHECHQTSTSAAETFYGMEATTYETLQDLQGTIIPCQYLAMDSWTMTFAL